MLDPVDPDCRAALNSLGLPVIVIRTSKPNLAANNKSTVEQLMDACSTA